MAAVSLTTLRARVREMADMVNSQFVTDAATSLDSFINSGIARLHDIVLENPDEDRFLLASVNSTTAGVSTINLPATFYALRGVDLTLDGEDVSLEPFKFRERNAVKHGWNRGMLPRYHLEPTVLRLYPAPDAFYVVTIWYAPAATVLVSAGDTINYPNGWEHYAELYAAILALNKEESDLGILPTLLAAEEQRIRDSAPRDKGAPPSVVDLDGDTHPSHWWVR